MKTERSRHLPSKPTIISLFSGCGGFDLGFQQAGFDVIWANEFNKFIWSTHEANLPDIRLDKRDIRQISSKEIPDSFGIIASPPCQAWSSLGKQQGVLDYRGDIFWEFLRVIKDKKPKFFICENVKGLLFSKFQPFLQKVLHTLKSIGYMLSVDLVDAYDYGVPQHRYRTFITGYDPASFTEPFQVPIGDEVLTTVRDAIWDLRNASYRTAIGLISQEKDLFTKRIRNHDVTIAAPVTLKIPKNPNSFHHRRNTVLSWSKPSATITATFATVPIHPDTHTDLRRLSVRECARLQTFPDDFSFLYTNVKHGYRSVGNAVPVRLARKLATKILTDIETFDIMQNAV